MRNFKLRGFEILPDYQDLDNPLAVTLPQRATSGSAGYDLRAISHNVVQPGEVKLIDTGLTAYMQEDEELQIRSRSGLATKRIIVANSPGTIDSDYYGKHIKVLIQNLSDEPFEINAGDRVAQAVFSRYLTADIDIPLSTIRSGGFGSTGVE